MAVEILTDELKYVFVTHLYKVSPSMSQDADIFFGAISEDSKKVKFCVLKGWKYVEGFQKGTLGEIPKKTLEAQIKEGVTDKMNVQYFLDEFVTEED